MKKLAITKAGFSAFPNAMHVELHTRILNLIDQQDATKLGLDATTVDSYRASIAKEQEYVNHPYASEMTPSIVAARAKRDNWYRYVRNSIEAAKYSPASAVAAAYETLEAKLLSVYPSLKEMADGQSATAQIRGFIQTAQDECATQVEALNLSSSIMMLASSNDDYSSKYIQRNAERAKAIPAEMKAARTTTDTLYRTLSYTLQGKSLLIVADSAEQTVNDNCAAVVDAVGTLLADWQLRLRISRRGAVVAPEVGSDADLAGDNGESGENDENDESDENGESY